MTRREPLRSILPWLGWAGLVLASPSFAAPARRAVIVGANRASPGRQPLRFSHRDAQGLAEVLIEVGGFRPDEVNVLLEPAPETAVPPRIQLGLLGKIEMRDRTGVGAAALGASLAIHGLLGASVAILDPPPRAMTAPASGPFQAVEIVSVPHTATARPPERSTRLTTCLERRGDDWVVVHEHHSMPTTDNTLIGPNVEKS